MDCLCFDCAPFYFAALDNDEEEVAVAGFIGAELDYLILLKTRDKPLTKASHSKSLHLFSLIVIYHACFLKILKFLQNKNMFLCGITTTIILLLLIILLPLLRILSIPNLGNVPSP